MSASTAAKEGQAPFGYPLVVFFVFLGYFRFASQPGDYRGMAVSTATFLFFCVPFYVVSQRKREKALLAIVQQEAPLLYRKLQQEGIV